MENLLSIVTLLIALSVASERLVEILKGLFPWLNEQKESAKEEGKRKAALQALAVAAGILTAFLALPAILNVVPGPWQSGGMQPFFTILALGLLTSGGSGLWNAVLAYLLRVKDIKKLEFEEIRARREAEVNA